MGMRKKINTQIKIARDKAKITRDRKKQKRVAIKKAKEATVAK